MSEVASNTSIPDYGWSSGTAEASHDYLQPVVLSALRTCVPIRATSARVFDAGCGNGALLKKLQLSGYEVSGCDASESGVVQARRLCGDSVRVERLSVYENLSETFGTHWDVVISTEVIEHLYAPRDFVRQAQRLLTPGGTLILSTPYHGYLKNLALAATGALDHHFTALWDGGHIKFWSYRTLKQLLSEFGFVDFGFFGAGRLPWLWKSMVVVARKPE
ncbi:class I SAM-dependent methyltransferase [Steroidobacter sp.]|uniref:class I SAM-dependent methyltransferase n=1 Tax=Steroidobacter sp. TaxID=1978227 RepID=UPI001A600641|nr:methyltransferase domain-containing protein [Steroidobacter sp.]MBL8267850.1 methyltransferase domain-containing protein [Steroidobacter sp.]